MGAPDKDSRTEKATPKKKRDERKKGNVFSSKDIVNFVTVLVSFYMLRFMFPFITEKLTGILYRFAGYAAEQTEINMNFTRQVLLDLTVAFAVIVLPIAVATSAAAIIATGTQTKFLVASDNLKPKFNRLNPLEGIKRMFSLKSVVEVLKSTIKVVVILYLIYMFFTGQLREIARTLTQDLAKSISLILSAVMQLVNNISIAFVAMAALDYMYQRWEYQKNLRMTKQEVKEEYKQMEGDPQVKGKIKEKQRSFAMSRMMQAVPGADVVIRNPTHYAVALRYDIDHDNAPTVVAKGADNVALKIVEIAQRSNVYVTEQPELTRAIYAAADLNQEIPLDFYKAVAELLAYVYQIKAEET